MAAKDASTKKEKELKEEIRTLRLKVEELEGEYSKAKAFTETLLQQRDDLEQELKEMRSRYANDITEWENRYELEQNERKKEQQKNRELLTEAKQDAKKRVKESKKAQEEKMKELYATHLADTEQKLRDLVQQVEGNKGYIEELESERTSIRKMFSHSVGLVSTRVKRGVQKVVTRTTDETGRATTSSSVLSSSSSKSAPMATTASTNTNTTTISGDKTAVGGSAGEESELPDIDSLWES